ncbi:hypothetical protein GCM10009416_38720 [Craurococcus roseus]|uniref:Uncharacterized protein n=1 Tax=Craurococcus roseus TaxID=77585 RepID=A0ABN1FS32_9PROT
MEQMQRRSPSAALVETFNAACAEPARNAVRRAARRLEFAPVAAGAPPREGAGGAVVALPEGGEAWRGTEEVGGAVLVWDEATSTCELRAQGVDLLLVESAFSRLPQALEEDGASITRLTPSLAPAGGVRTRQMLLVQPGRFSRPERARVLRLDHHLSARGAEAAADSDTVTLSARAVSAPR